jgi:hypothetical protein
MTRWVFGCSLATTMSVGPWAVESLDLAAHLAEPMPIAVLGQLLGVSLSEAEGRQLKRWCDDFLLPFGRDIGTLSPDELARVRSAGEGYTDLWIPC